MDLGEIRNQEARASGKPLEGIHVVSLEQMQALPYATQLLGRLGATIVKVEHPVHGESGRGAQPSMRDPYGRDIGATFLRNNLSKKSVGIDLKNPAGAELVWQLASRADVLAENFKAGTMERLGLGYDEAAKRLPQLIYASISGFGNLGESPYRSWPAYAMVPEAMSGLYDFSRIGDEPPRVIPAGALGDISTGLFAVIGVLAALRHREITGRGQYVDIAMLDSMLSMADVVTNMWSLGVGPGQQNGILGSFRCADGWFVMQVVREPAFAALADLIDAPEWLTDERLATRRDWFANLETLLRPRIEAWAANRTRAEIGEALSAANIATGPVYTASEIIDDPHTQARNMMVRMPRTDGVDEPVLIPGNPVKMSNVAEGPEYRVPWVGEHTYEVLGAECGLDEAALDDLADRGIISPRI
jgi:crotonobetainyl-CoA:carnitine CoA-transferase CaiB-like acyl-CoA transferase